MRTFFGENGIYQLTSKSSAAILLLPSKELLIDGGEFPVPDDV